MLRPIFPAANPRGAPKYSPKPHASPDFGVRGGWVALFTQLHESRNLHRFTVLILLRVRMQARGVG
jgi:hypothetical protein